MSLNIRNKDVERLIDEETVLTGESMTEAVRRALEKRRARLAYHHASEDRGARLRRFLEGEAWPQIPDAERGRGLTGEEEDDILGYGEHGA